MTSSPSDHLGDVAVAVLFSGDVVTGETSMDTFREDDETQASWSDGRTMDPYHRAHGLQLSCEDDFPTRVWSIWLNERARKLMGDERMRQMGLVD